MRKCAQQKKNKKTLALNFAANFSPSLTWKRNIFYFSHRFWFRSIRRCSGVLHLPDDQMGWGNRSSGSPSWDFQFALHFPRVHQLDRQGVNRIPLQHLSSQSREKVVRHKNKLSTNKWRNKETITCSTFGTFQ